MNQKADGKVTSTDNDDGLALSYVVWLEANGVKLAQIDA